jgi:hypothetical protein
MLDSAGTWIAQHGKALTGTALGVVIVLLFGQSYVQSRQADERFDKLLVLFSEHQKDMKDTARNQWQNQSKIADGLNAIALTVASGLARIEATLHIPPDKRGPLAVEKPADAPKIVELKPPM